MTFQFVNWDNCIKIWNECSKNNTAFGCIGTTILEGILIIILITIILFAIRFIPVGTDKEIIHKK